MSQPDRLKLPEAKYTAREINDVTDTTTINDVRTESPTEVGWCRGCNLAIQQRLYEQSRSLWQIDFVEEHTVTLKFFRDAALTAVSMTLLTTAPQAAADYEQYAMNGSFSVVANGEWAKMNDRYQDQPTMDSTWTVTSVCSSAFTCAGKVSSSQGWTEDVYTTSGDQWYVRHAVPEWIPCPDGTTAPGLQVFTFYRAAETGLQDLASTTWIGQDQTTGVSGNCGRNRSLVLNMPLKITRID